jgi:hypothetical protein
MEFIAFNPGVAPSTGAMQRAARRFPTSGAIRAPADIARATGRGAEGYVYASRQAGSAAVGV